MNTYIREQAYIEINYEVVGLSRKLKTGKRLFKRTSIRGLVSLKK